MDYFIFHFDFLHIKLLLLCMNVKKEDIEPHRAKNVQYDKPMGGQSYSITGRQLNESRWNYIRMRRRDFPEKNKAEYQIQRKSSRESQADKRKSMCDSLSLSLFLSLSPTEWRAQ